jgi:hypothetical protein
MRNLLIIDSQALLDSHITIGYLKKKVYDERKGVFEKQPAEHTTRFPGLPIQSLQPSMHFDAPLRLPSMHLRSSQELLPVRTIFCLGNPPLLEDLLSAGGASRLKCHLERVGLDNEKRIRLV